MLNFDFYNLLFPTEFENFCRDILEIREPNIKFTTYKKGKDGGIDIKSTNSQLKIIGQCKLYHPQNYNGLLSSLKREVAKCKRQKPDRYLICTNIELSPSRAEEIKKLFGNFIINEEDIIDGIKLNKYLGQKEYGYLFKTYSKLLVPNLSSIEIALEKIVHKKYYNKTKLFLEELNTKHKLFHNTEQLPHLIQKLEDNKVIILSGNPGVGKTTTAMMIANYFFTRKKCDVLYLEERDYPETLALAAENRLIIVDDFWGQNFSPSIQNHSTFQRELQSIIKYFISSSNSYLILVSRDYVIKDALANAEYDTKTLVNQNKYLINIEAFSFEDKLRIFLNHLLFYDYDLSYISQVKYNDKFEYILNHPNYSPRHLDFFIKIYSSIEHKSSYQFYESLQDYLEKPLAFWKEAFGKLNPTAQLILLILLVSSDPLDLQGLKQSFDAVQTEARQTLNVNIIPLEFQKELIKLEEFYISILEDDNYETTLIEFQSPGIKDYLLEYLRIEGYSWINPIISNAVFFNQLTFIFDTDEDKNVMDSDSEIHLYGKKIKLDGSLQKALKQKLISEFDNLHFSNYEEREFSDQLTRFDSDEDIKYLKLLEIRRLFDFALTDDDDIKAFVVKQVLSDFDAYNKQQKKIVSLRSTMYFPGIIKSVYPYLGISADDIILAYYNSITAASEYEDFYEFNEIFPSEFQRFYNTNLVKIKQHIKDLLFDNIDYYLWQDNGKIGIELDRLINLTIEDLSKKYKIRITRKFVQELESTFDISFSSLLKQKVRKYRKAESKQPKTKKKYKPKSYESIVDEYLPEEEDTYNPIPFLKEHKYHRYVKEIKKNNSILSLFKKSKLIFEDICHYLAGSDIDVAHTNIFHLLDSYFKTYSSRLKINPDTLVSLYYQIINELEWSNYYSITKSKLEQLLSNLGLTNLPIVDLEPILIPYKNWYKLSAGIFEEYFLAKHIYAIQDNDQFKEEIINTTPPDPDNNQILEFLQTIDKPRLWNFYIVPELDKLIKHIDFSDEKTKAISFIDFFSIDFELSWNIEEKTFETVSSSGAEVHYEKILQLCNIQFYIDDFEVYFMEEFQGKDSVERLYINTKMVKPLVQIIRTTIKPEEYYHKFMEKSIKAYEIKLVDFLKSERNYQAVKDAGMITYIDRILENIKSIITS
ncbi:MAG: ATP-binding protein [Chitinophagaceae bacterium]|nr:ATP-binding protein [Chitinophagaceae bacterium]